MEKKQLAEKYLANKPLQYLPVSESLRRGTGKIVFAAADALLVHDHTSGSFYLSAANEKALRPLLSLLDPADWVLLLELAYQPLLEERGYRPFHEPIYTAAYLRPDIALPRIDGLEIRPLTEEHLPLVLAHYRLNQDPEYIRERIDYGMLGAFYHGQPAGFVGVHDEGSMGLLEVLPAFRRLGIGSALGAHMVKSELQRGHIPYDQYFSGNTASRQMQGKLGFAFSDQPTLWLLAPDTAAAEE